MADAPMITEHEKLIKRAARVVNGDHERGCQGREYSCDCGYDEEKDAVIADLVTALTDALSQLDTTRAERDACRQQAEQWKMEAMGHKSSLYEAYQVLTDATGEPGNWNGAKPFKDFLRADYDVIVVGLREWVHTRFGKWITHHTARQFAKSVDIERRARARAALKHQGAET